MSTIAAIATPRAVGGISVIRISGEEALAVADRIFRPISTEKTPSEMEGYTTAYGKITAENGEIIDDVVIAVFTAPRSYTGENVVEISCHGGIFVTNEVLSLCYKNGAVPAAAGEFTKRAFLAGKMNLLEVEAVMDIISAEGVASRKAASSLKESKLFSRISAVSTKILRIIGEIGAWVDYPEEDIEELSVENLTAELTVAGAELEAILQTYDVGKIAREGIETAIIGKPNVGKSSLMNLFSGENRSIVTDIAGTTRDVIEETVRISDVVLRLSDTAGIRKTDDIVEEFGVQKAVTKSENAELILAVFDNSSLLSDEDFEIIKLCKGKNAIAIINKNDLECKIDRDFIEENFERVVYVCSHCFVDLEKIADCINSLFKTDCINYDAGIICNERQRSCVIEAKSALDEAVLSVSYGHSLDATGILLDDCVNKLLSLTGEKATEAVVDEIFSKFCVGK